MSTETAFRLELLEAKRQGLRVAIAVTVGLCTGLMLGDPLPFLAPLFATQFLLASRHPPALLQGMMTVLVVILTGALLVFFSGLLRERPWVLLPLLWLFYFACFAAQGWKLGGAAPALMLVIAIVVPLLDILQRNLGESIVLLLAKAISLGMMLSWATHALLPNPDGECRDEQISLGHDRGLVIRQAAASGVILLAMVALCVSDARLATAMVIPITVASLLSQFELSMSFRSALGLVMVNLLGGVAASLAFALFELRPFLWLVALIVLLISLLFAGNAAMGNTRGKIFGGGLIVFLILFGLGISPLPTSTLELFSTRIAYVLGAGLYAIILAALLWPRPRSFEQMASGISKDQR
ncbi:membrane protein [Stutzerimonas stutzeri]|uniref:Membrane protein n=1 Tax=Stutzerimonas stutzeri TaxID=316 RepID=W8QXJ8_STUST|nr:DUF2955 domain-containing protein [Stutzerimonas stutzeri]AHL75355.1 membrane protein [Stutzerimonas stutzeri]MCQ4328091.1 DUF2955 domain-containing protein [Stutzerimonas stutzeri]